MFRYTNIYFDKNRITAELLCNLLLQLTYKYVVNIYSCQDATFYLLAPYHSTVWMYQIEQILVFGSWVCFKIFLVISNAKTFLISSPIIS